VADALGQIVRTSAPPERALPREPRVKEPRPPDRRAGPGRRRFDSPARVLLIEPQDDTRLLYTCLFEEAGYAVSSVPNGIAAMSVAQQRLPDVIVMEVDAPGADACEVLRRLREDPVTSSIPVIVVTSLLHFDVPVLAPSSGAVLVLETPTGPEALLAEVDGLLQTAPPDRAVLRRLRRSLTTLRALGKQLTQDESARERLRTIIDRLQVAILVFDEQGRYVAVSRGASMLTGYSPAELLSMSVSDFGGSSLRLLADSWREFQTNQRSAIQTTIRDKSGNVVNIQTAFATLLPGLHAAAFAIEHEANGTA
jgi:PAS domain S-box-containing protein